MSAVHQHRQLDRPRPSEINERIQSGTDGPAGVEHVVDEDDVLAIDVEEDLRGLQLRLFKLAQQIIPVQRDIEKANLQLDTLRLLDFPGDPFREEFAARPDPDDDNALRPLVSLEDLVSQTGQRSVNADSVHDLGLQSAHGRIPWE